LDACVHIEQFDPQTDSRSLRACFDMTEAGWPVDHPDTPPFALESFTGKWSGGFDGYPQQAWLATDEAGDAVGGYLLDLPDRENTDRAKCYLIVALDQRRAGIGSALLAHCAGQARRAGRRWLTSNATDNSAGAAFAAAAGARGGITEIQRVLTIDDGLPVRLARLRASAEPYAAGYSLLSWSGPTPDELLDRAAQIHNAMADAPRDDGVVPRVWDADRLRQAERHLAEHNLHSHTVAAMHDATGAITAITELLTEEGTPGWAFQMITAVLPAHRGHRLGLLVKVAMLESLAGWDVPVHRIETGNAGANEHMIAINEQLGFQVTTTHRSWELDLAGAGSAARA
jgi:GNAT superfamily N-acetyltransferase